MGNLGELEGTKKNWEEVWERAQRNCEELRGNGRNSDELQRTKGDWKEL